MEEGDLCVMFSNMWQCDCVYQWHKTIGWHIVCAL